MTAPAGKAAPLLSATASAGDALLTLLYPRRCLLCETPEADILCATCSEALVEPVPDPLCVLCGHHAATSPCAYCRDDPPAFTFSRAVGRYSGGLREAIQMLKYHDRPMLARPLGAMMAQYARSIPHRFGELQLDAVVPIPMGRGRLVRRGYNQAERLARAVAADLGVPIRAQFLRRTGHARPQVGLGRVQRRQNPLGAFEGDLASEGLRILLVDDVTTTGATMKAGALALKSVGAKAVYGLALAAE